MARKSKLLARREFTANVLYFKDEAINEWVAHCLDLDIMAQGAQLEDAERAVVDAMRVVLGEAHAMSGDPMSGQARAPSEFWEQRNAIIRDGVPVPGPISATPRLANRVIATYHVKWEAHARAKSDTELFPLPMQGSSNVFAASC